jgi:hypothetical protein
MFRRSTWILVAFFLISLLVMVYLRQRDEAPGVEATPQPTQAPLFSFSSDAINSLRVESQAGDVVDMQRDQDGAWQVVEPAAPEADQGQISSAVLTLTSIMVQTTVDPSAPLDVLGLQLPEYVIRFEVEGAGLQELHVGRKTPIGNGYNVRHNDGPAVIVSSFSIDPLLLLLEEPPVIEPTPTPEADGTDDEPETATPVP